MSFGLFCFRIYGRTDHCVYSEVASGSVLIGPLSPSAFALAVAAVAGALGGEQPRSAERASEQGASERAS